MNEYFKLEKIPDGWSNATIVLLADPRVGQWEPPVILEQTLDMLYYNILSHFYPIKIIVNIYMIYDLMSLAYIETTNSFFHMHTFQNPYDQTFPSPNKLGFICKNDLLYFKALPRGLMSYE